MKIYTTFELPRLHFPFMGFSPPTFPVQSKTFNDFPSELLLIGLYFAS